MTDLLSIGRSGIRAYRGALAAVGENVTNSDTDGFARRSVTLKEQSSAGGALSVYKATTSFGGVQAASVKRVWDQYKAAAAWSSGSDANRSSTRAQYASTVEGMLNDSDTGVGTKLTAVFTSGTNLAANPKDPALRQTMLAALGGAASAISQTAANLAKVADTVRSQATTMVGATNDALTSLAKLNIALHSMEDGTAARAQVEDQRDALIGTISGNIAVDVTFDTKGAASLKLNDHLGPVLLSSTSVVPGFLTLQVAADGRMATSVTASDGSVTAASPTGGALAGLIDAAGSIAGRRLQLDGLASDFIGKVNAWNGQGVDANGVAGGQLLIGSTAASISVAVTDPNLIAAAIATTTAGVTTTVDNANLLALSALRGPTGVEASWRSIVTDQALQVSAAKTEATAASTRKDSAYSALDEVTGVDLDTEAAQLLRYQQAYSASAKIIQAARDTLQSILDLF